MGCFTGQAWTVDRVADLSLSDLFTMPELSEWVVALVFCHNLTFIEHNPDYFVVIVDCHFLLFPVFFWYVFV